jgi:hypothetical protein
MALAVVEATCGDDGGMSQTNDVVVAMALAMVAETSGDDGATSQTNGVVVTMAQVVAVAVTCCDDDGVMS